MASAYQVTSFAEIRARLEAHPVKRQRQWHARVKNSYREGQPCDHCGHQAWNVGRVTAECGNPRCGNAVLKEKVG